MLAAATGGPVGPSRPRTGLAVSFLALVVLPILVAGIYIVTMATEQFDSTVGFSIRHEEAASPIDAFGGFSGIAATGPRDADVLYEFLTSQEVVEAVDARVDLRSLWSSNRASDPVFAFNPTGTVEDLARHWRRMVNVSHDTASGILTVRVRAFDPVDAQNIATTTLAVSGDLVDRLTSIAQSDILAEAEVALVEAEDRLRRAREARTVFRAETQVVDPGADISGQMGLLTRLQEGLADEIIRLDLLRMQTRPDDPRIDASEQRIAVIEERIAGERRKLGSGGAVLAAADYASVVAEFERLSIDVEFAQENLLAARAAHVEALAEARRRTRYLAAHIKPTLAERATAPDPVVILGLGAVILSLAWGAGVLVVAALRDRA